MPASSGNSYVPPPDVGSSEEKEKIRLVVAARGLVGAANDTKWRLLLERMREREGWRPSYRFKTVAGPPSSWDVEWFYHLPFPMMSVEWFDIGLEEKTLVGRLLSPVITNHGEWILAILSEARFCFEVRGAVVRIFGYLPKDYSGFPEETV
jgi:hypothetical protein